MKSIMLVLALLTSSNVFAFSDYDVDWPPTNEKGVHILRIVIDDCKTTFKIKDEDFYSATANEKALQDALVKAIERAGSGCN